MSCLLSFYILGGRWMKPAQGGNVTLGGTTGCVFLKCIPIRDQLLAGDFHEDIISSARNSLCQLVSYGPSTPREERGPGHIWGSYYLSGRSRASRMKPLALELYDP